MSQQSVGQLDRQKYLGGSDVAAILGISPWKTPLDVYLDKTEGRQPEDASKKKIFARGVRLEPYILQMLEEETTIRIKHRGNRYQDADYGFLAAEIDAEAETGENIEVKSVHQFGSKAWGEQGTDAIPVYYTAQAMHGMMITGAKQTIFPVLIGLDDFRIYNVERDEETIVAIRQKELAFWEMIQNKTPPPVTAVSDIMRMFERDTGSSIEATDEIMVAFKELKRYKAERKMLDDDIDTVEERIKLYMMGNSALTFGGRPVATWKSQDANRLDLERFRSEQPALAASFMKTTTSRVFRTK